MSATAHVAKISSLTPQLATQIIGLIRCEAYPLGYRLTEQALCEKLTVSRTPIRRALRYLEEKGVVSSAQNKGFQVAKSLEKLGSLELTSSHPTDDDFYLRIANDRIHGVLSEEVTEVSLMERYQLSRHQIQRILNRMNRESMVDRKPGRGWIFDHC